MFPVQAEPEGTAAASGVLNTADKLPMSVRSLVSIQRGDLIRASVHV